MITELDPSVHTEGQGVEETRTSLATSREALGQLVLPAVLAHITNEP